MDVVRIDRDCLSDPGYINLFGQGFKNEICESRPEDGGRPTPLSDATSG